jgi:hypothetical protein
MTRRTTFKRAVGASLAAVCMVPGASVALAQGAACPALAGHSIEPALIGLPSGPARIVSATVERFAGVVLSVK